jgi:hypothetical protein
MKIVGTAKVASTKRTKNRHHNKNDRSKGAGEIKPFNKKKLGSYDKINPIVELKDRKTRDSCGDAGKRPRIIYPHQQLSKSTRDIQPSSNTSVGGFTAWERAAASRLEIFFAKSKENMLAPRVLFDEESFYEGSFDEDFLSEDNEKLERYRKLEERVSSRLQAAVDQDDTASIVSLDGVSIFDLPDEESDDDYSNARVDRSISANAIYNTSATSRSRFNFEKAKPVFVSSRRSRNAKASRTSTDETVKTTPEPKMASLRKLFRRKRHNQSEQSKFRTRNNRGSGRIPDNTRRTHRIHVIEGTAETRSEETCRSTRNKGIPEDREEELEFDDDYDDFVDDFPFDSCLCLSGL